MVACIYDKEDILTILLENGADLGAKDNVSNSFRLCWCYILIPFFVMYVA